MNNNKTVRKNISDIYLKYLENCEILNCKKIVIEK